MNKTIKLALLIMLSVILDVLSPAAGLAAPELDINRLPEWEVRLKSLGGTLLLSDSPEMVTADGILYRDKVVGAVRLFFYHVNAAEGVKKIAVLLENHGKKTARITVSQAAWGGPGNPWLKIGKETQAAYLGDKQSYQLNIPPAGIVSLSENLSELPIVPGTLINGIFDFEADHPITVTVIMLPVTEDSIKFSKTAKVLPPDEYHLRGTFAGANRTLAAVSDYDPATDGAVGITLADDVIDPYLWGIDATDGSRVINYGNYGVVYKLLLPSKKGGKVAYYLAPMGGSYAGAVGINHPNATWSPVITPRDRLFFGDAPKKELAFLGTFEGGDPLSFIFSPPGASNLPAKIVIISQK